MYQVCSKSFLFLYMQVPDDEEYNAIAFEGLISNPDVVHHILVFGCDFEVENFVSMPIKVLESVKNHAKYK